MADSYDEGQGFPVGGATPAVDISIALSDVGNAPLLELA
jgi:hypothetical protein